MERLSILLLAAAHSPNTDSLVRTWSGLGHQVHVVTFHPDGGRHPAVTRFPVRAGKAGYALQRRRIRAVIATLKPDVVVGYHITSYGVAAAMAGFHPWVAVAAGGDILPEQYGSAFRAAVMPAVARWVLGRADFVFSWAGHMTDRLVELGGDPERILTLPRGVDTTLFRPAMTMPPAGAHLVSTRSLKKVYQIDRLIEAAAVVAARRPELRISVAGAGPERTSLEQLCASRSLTSQVRFLGEIPKLAIADLLRENRIYISLSRSDGVSASLLEAMATGAVPIVSDIPANRDWVTDRVNGFLVDPGNRDQVASAIEAASDSAVAERCWIDNPRLIAERGAAHVNGTIMLRVLQQLADTRQLQAAKTVTAHGRT